MSLKDRQASAIFVGGGVPRLSAISKKNISEASVPFFIKFNANHYWDGGLNALGFGADCFKIVVSMVTDSSHRLTMGKTKKIFSETRQGCHTSGKF